MAGEKLLVADARANINSFKALHRLVCKPFSCPSPGPLADSALVSDLMVPVTILLRRIGSFLYFGRVPTPPQVNDDDPISLSERTGCCGLVSSSKS